jgi:hypothetical protein
MFEEVLPGGGVIENEDDGAWYPGSGYRVGS